MSMLIREQWLYSGSGVSHYITSLTAQIGQDTAEVPGLPEEYKEYVEVFSMQKAKILPKH